MVETRGCSRKVKNTGRHAAGPVLENFEVFGGDKGGDQQKDRVFQHPNAVLCGRNFEHLFATLECYLFWGKNHYRTPSIHTYTFIYIYM